ATSDYWRSLISLWEDGLQKKVWEDMLRYRDGRGRNFGNSFFRFMSEKTGGLAKVDDLFKKLTLANLKGKVIPVSLSPANICFKCKSGKVFEGEHFLDDMRMSNDFVEKIWLSPKVKANPEAIDSLVEADLIIVCPGSVYGSLITNFLVEGVGEALEKSKAKKVLMVNIMSVANDGDVGDQEKYANLFKKYVEIDFDLLLMADLGKLNKKKIEKVIQFYKLENSSQIEYLKNKDNVIMADIATIDEVNWRLRHSKSKLAKFFAKMDLCPRKN
ncbi:YvcK family protein, partial [Patescibacteria group bacterium]|nr:YvcK family protein [Patescibacteria group bacterium]